MHFSLFPLFIYNYDRSLFIQSMLHLISYAIVGPCFVSRLLTLKMKRESQKKEEEESVGTQRYKQFFKSMSMLVLKKWLAFSPQTHSFLTKFPLQGSEEIKQNKTKKASHVTSTILPKVFSGAIPKSYLSSISST
uniref:Uncharacterized protein n=1 Tax=Micrurus carvalhoi TaxID=3147026 RepID=A0A2H6MY87_9SAUR